MFDAHLMEMLWEGVLDTLYMTVVSTVSATCSQMSTHFSKQL